MKKYFKVFRILVFVFIISIFVIFLFPLIKQEENTGKILVGIVKLVIGEDEFILYDRKGSLEFYISKNEEERFEYLNDLMEKKGYLYTEQMGSGYIFTHDSEDEKVVVTRRQFSRFFLLWMVP
jgi:hypothetical protein